MGEPMATADVTSSSSSRPFANARLPFGIVVFLGLALFVLGIDQFLNALTLFR